MTGDVEVPKTTIVATVSYEVHPCPECGKYPPSIRQGCCCDHVGGDGCYCAAKHYYRCLSCGRSAAPRDVDLESTIDGMEGAIWGIRSTLDALRTGDRSEVARDLWDTRCRLKDMYELRKQWETEHYERERSKRG